MKKSSAPALTATLLVLFSLLFHAGLIGLFYGIARLFPSSPQTDIDLKKVVWVEPQKLPLDLAIADIEKPAVEQVPAKARFTGEANSKVATEQVSPPRRPTPAVRPATPRKPAIKVHPTKTPEPEPAETPTPEPKEKPSPKEEVPEPQAKEPEPSPQKAKPKTVSKKPDPEEPEEKPNEKPDPKPDIPKRLPGDFSLKPSDVFKEPPKKAASKSPSVSRSDFQSVGSGLSLGRQGASGGEFFPDYKIGSKTFLNVMKLQDIGYFVKMKRILKMRWNPIPAVQNYLASTRVEVGRVECVVGVALDETGQIKQLFLIKGSGSGLYDREAMSTIRDSSPFSSPPAQFLKNGELLMAWTFTVYL